MERKQLFPLFYLFKCPNRQCFFSPPSRTKVTVCSADFGWISLSCQPVVPFPTTLFQQGGIVPLLSAWEKTCVLGVSKHHLLHHIKLILILSLPFFRSNHYLWNFSSFFPQMTNPNILLSPTGRAQVPPYFLSTLYTCSILLEFSTFTYLSLPVIWKKFYL